MGNSGNKDSKHNAFIHRTFPQKGPKANDSFRKVEVTTVTNSSTALDGFHSSQPLI